MYNLRKKVIKGIVLVVALIVAVLLLRGCGKEETVPEMTWSQADRPVYAYEEAKARYIWSAYEGKGEKVPRKGSEKYLKSCVYKVSERKRRHAFCIMSLRLTSNERG